MVSIWSPQPSTQMLYDSWNVSESGLMSPWPQHPSVPLYGKEKLSAVGGYVLLPRAVHAPARQTKKSKSVSKRSCHLRGAQLLGMQKEQDIGASNPFFIWGILSILIPPKYFFLQKITLRGKINKKQTLTRSQVDGCIVLRVFCFAVHHKRHLRHWWYSCEDAD